MKGHENVDYKCKLGGGSCVCDNTCIGLQDEDWTWLLCVYLIKEDL